MGVLVRPGPGHLPGYIAALKRGWSPNTVRDVSDEELAQVKADVDGFLAAQDDPMAKAGDIVLPDGTRFARIPSFRRFIWDNGFCGVISLRWLPGTTDLPPNVSGHIGFSVVPWKQQSGYARRALAELLPEARVLGMPFVELTANTSNAASRRVIEKCGGEIQKTYVSAAHLGACEVVLYRIYL